MICFITVRYLLYTDRYPLSSLLGRSQFPKYDLFIDYYYYYYYSTQILETGTVFPFLQFPLSPGNLLLKRLLMQTLCFFFGKKKLG